MPAWIKISPNLFFSLRIDDEIEKKSDSSFLVIPIKAGIQYY